MTDTGARSTDGGIEAEDYVARVARALIAIRSYLRLSQKDLAALAGVSDSTISRYEAGLEKKANAEQLVRIALRADVPIDLLLNPPASEDEVMEQLALHRARQRAARGNG